MADRGYHPRPEANGLVSLVQALLGGAALLLAGVAFVFLGSGPVIPTLEDLPGVQAAGEPVAAATPASADTADDLRVSVRGPARLIAGRPAPLDVRLGDAAAGLGSGQQRVLLTFDLELRREARGWVLVGPGRLLTSAADLPREAITLTGLRGIDCGTPLGTLTVTARELVEEGRSGQVTYQLPEVACPGDDVPEAPESLHLQQRVWDSGNGDWRAQVARLLAPAPPSTTSTSTASAPAPSPAPTRTGTDDTASDDRESRERSSGGTTDADEAPKEPQTDSTKPREPADEDDAAPEKEPEADDSDAREPSPDDGDVSDTDGQRGNAGGSPKD